LCVCACVCVRVYALEAHWFFRRGLINAYRQGALAVGGGGGI
jgi:hypothetical protein